MTTCSTFPSTCRAPANPSAYPLLHLQVGPFPCKAISLAVPEKYTRQARGQKERIKCASIKTLPTSGTSDFPVDPWSSPQQPCKLHLPVANSIGEPERRLEVSAKCALSCCASFPLFKLNKRSRGRGLNFQPT